MTEIQKIKLRTGIAGEIAADAYVTYEDNPVETITFVGSIYGGPVVMILPNGVQTFVRNNERFGNFATDRLGWVRTFFGDDDTKADNSADF